jgi:tRNA(Ile)-lysidine synthase
MLSEFLKFIRENKLVTKKEKVVLAVSGGIDSMVMASLFTEAGFLPGIAHCNFSLRGNESDLDEELVRLFASDHKLEFHSVRFETKEYAATRKISVQMAARELRYDWFAQLRNESGYHSTAVAHNKNDNVETILINLIRGTGITGLTGMKPSGNGIIRPLLFATREQIEDYCSHNRIIYREDKSNAETRYMRNKIRHQIIPVLKEINPSIEDSITETSERLNGTLGLLENYIESIRSSVSLKKGDSIIFNIKSLQNMGLTDSLAFELFKPYGINSTTSGDLQNVIKGRTGGQIVTHSNRIIRNREELIVSPVRPKRAGEFVIDTIEGFPGLPFNISAEIIDYNTDLKFPDNNYTAFFDFDKITFPLTIRKWVKGDVFFPLGMDHPKKLSDYFIDRKFSLPEKENVMLLVSGGQIVWIIGERIDNRFRVTQSTTLVLRLEYKQ